MIKCDLHRAWMELSERAEHFLMKHGGGHQFLIHASLLSQLLNTQVDGNGLDGYHHVRQIHVIKKTNLQSGVLQLDPPQMMCA